MHQPSRAAGEWAIVGVVFLIAFFWVQFARTQAIQLPAVCCGSLAVEGARELRRQFG
jgi:hypothetical protein